MPKELEV